MSIGGWIGIVDYEEIGRKVRQAREAHGLSQEELGNRLGYTGPTVSGWETNRRHISLDDLYRVARELNRPLSHFLGDIAETPSVSERLANILRKPLADFLPVKRIPLLNTIPAETPDFTVAETAYGNEITVPAEWEADFAVRVEGDSMAAAAINDGDIVVCRKGKAGEHGDLVVVSESNGGGIAVRFLVNEGGRWLIRAADGTGYPDKYTGNNTDKIQGVVTMIVHAPPKLPMVRTDYACRQAERIPAVKDEWAIVIQEAERADLSPERIRKMIAIMRDA